jgi:ABC-type glycerol-3-phosphate transport system permease component
VDVPIIGTFVTSFRPLDDANSTGGGRLHQPVELSDLTFDNYTEAWTAPTWATRSSTASRSRCRRRSSRS